MNKFHLISSTLFILATLVCEASKQPTDLKVTEIGYMSILLEWTPHTEFGDYQVIERKGPGEAEYTEHLRLPTNAWRYKDLGLEANAYYQYRIKTVSPDDESLFSYVAQKTTPNPYTATFNVKDYGAVGDGATNDTAAIRNAIAAATNNGGGTIYFPTGTYAVCPDIDNPANTVIFKVNGSNLHFLGDGPELSILSCYSPGLQDPETSWSLDTKGEIRRGSAFSLNFDVAYKQTNVVFEGLRVTGNTRPTGDTLWWTNEQRANGWDIYHKGLYLGAGNDNILIRNCIWDNWRGEIIYSGDPNMKKVKLEDTQVYGTNSSAISTSADFECDGIEVWDAANACIESAFYHNLNGNNTGTQMGIFRNSLFEPRREMLVSAAANPLLTDPNMGKFGAAVFNSQDSYLVFQGCTFKHGYFAGLYFAVAQHDTLITQNYFDNTGIQGHITFDPHDKPDYQMEGGVFDVLIKDNGFHSSQGNGKILNTAIYSENAMENVHFLNNRILIDGGDNIVFHDAYPYESGRVNFVIADNVITEGNGDYINRFSYDVRAKTVRPAIAPLWINNTFPLNNRNESDDVAVNVYNLHTEPLEIALHGPYKKLHDFHYGTTLSLKKYLDRYPEGFEVIFRKTYDRNYALFSPDPTWNDLSYDQPLRYNETITLRKENGIFRLISRDGIPVLKFDRNKTAFVDNSSSKNSPVIFEHYTGLEKGDIGHVFLRGQDITLTEYMLTNSSNADKIFDSIDGELEIKLMRDPAVRVLHELDEVPCTRVIRPVE